jgi:hypothetical protein
VIRNSIMRCVICNVNVSLPTGWVLSTKSWLCGACAREFARWYKQRMCRQNHDKGAGCFNEAAAGAIKGEEGAKK